MARIIVPSISAALLSLGGCTTNNPAERGDAAPVGPAPTSDARTTGNGGNESPATDGNPAPDLEMTARDATGRPVPRDVGSIPTDARNRTDALESSDASSTDSGPPRPDAQRPPEALDIPANQWSAVMIEGMTCADGTPTGIAVNPGPPGTRRIFFYFIGGGACWDADSCYRNPRASFIDEPMLPQAFIGSDLERFPYFDRANPENPFAQDTMVFVPYCTGDIHAGARVANYDGRETRHVGATNFALLAARLSAAYPDIDRVVLSGGSAGGYGAALNWQRALDAFPQARIDVVDDSGPIVAPPHLDPGLLATWSAAWDLPSTVPPDCETCAVDLSAHIPHGLVRARGGRFGLLSSVGDGVIASYFNTDAEGIAAGLTALQAGAPPGYGAFLVPGDSHVIMASPWVAGGRTIPAWIRAMLADDPAWGSVGPDPLPPCNELADCGQCAFCATEGPCEAEYAACNRLGGCVDAVVCALGCAAADQGCITACAVAFRAGQEALDLYRCARCETCSAACGACP